MKIEMTYESVNDDRISVMTTLEVLICWYIGLAIRCYCKYWTCHCQYTHATQASKTYCGCTK